MELCYNIVNSLENNQCTLGVFLDLLENVLLLIPKCVEIYVYDNSGDELTLVQLSHVVFIMWTD